MERSIDASSVLISDDQHVVGLTPTIVSSAIGFVHRVLDTLDNTLVSHGESRLAKMVELANLSAIIGNLLRTGVSNASNGRFVVNGPHKHPDLLSKEDGVKDLEIKVALEANMPKGHLVKPGPHLICRYVLGGPKGKFIPGKDGRGDVVWIWELRAGEILNKHFSVSNTEGDSGKTAVIKSEGFNQLQLIYCSMRHFPAGSRKKLEYEKLLDREAAQAAPL